MVLEVTSDQLVTPSLEETHTNDYRQLAELLIEALPSDRKEMWAGKVMIYLASQTMLATSQGKEPPRVSTKTIYLDLSGNPNKEPSSWLSPIWNEIEARHYPEIEPTLIELCRQAGLTVYPIIEKDNGKPAFYRMATKPLPASPNQQSSADTELPRNAIRYKPDLSLGLSSFGRLLFGRGLQWTPFKRFSYLTWQMLFLLAAAGFDVLLWMILWYSKGPLSGQELVVTAMAIVLPLGIYWHFRDIYRLFDDRIIMAPDWILSWKEFGASVEINRSKNTHEPSTILVLRYTSTCPICGWMVKLDRGEPDFPRRIVGRCEEHPREHVFSFDRTSKLGELLQRGVVLPNKPDESAIPDA